MKKTKLMLGDNIELLKKLPDNSVDSVVTDPPYGLSFMNKKWDYDVPSVEFWSEVYRVLKPGGHVLSFGGTRTYHRMVVNIEDAGFEIRDQIQWIYGSGFPKSLNVSKKIEQDIDNLIYNNIWKNKLDNVKIVEPTLKKSQIEVGNNMKKQNSAQENVAVIVKEKLNYQNVIVVESNSTEVHHILRENLIVQESVGQFIIQQQDLVKCVEQLDKDQIVKLLNIFIVEESVKDMLREHSMNKIKVEEVQKTLNGNEKFYVLEIIPVLCVVLPKILKHIILNQSRTFQNLDTKLQMDCVSATSVTITKYIMEHLIGNTVNTLRKRIDFTIDNGHSALKPANEPICVARKPLSEKSVAENVLKWRTGGINVDGCRVSGETINTIHNPKITGKMGQAHGEQKGYIVGQDSIHEGRFPANIILECICDDSIIHDDPNCPCRLLDEQSGESKSRSKYPEPDISSMSMTYYDGKEDEKGVVKGLKKEQTKEGFTDKGGASRFFYQAKVSKAERNMSGKCSHPTLKPIQLMSYLCKLVTPQNGIILDPFSGSGSTGISALLNDFRFIGMEKEQEYFDIMEKRIADYESYRKFIKKV